MSTIENTTAPAKILITQFPTFGKTLAQIQEKVQELGEPAELAHHHAQADIGLQISALVANALMNVGDETMFFLDEVEHGQSPDMALPWAFAKRVTGRLPGTHGDIHTSVFAAAGQVYFELVYCEPVHSDEDYACSYEITAKALASPEAAIEAARSRWEFEQLREFSGFLRQCVVSDEHAAVFKQAIARLTDPATTAGMITPPATRQAIASLRT